MKELFWASSNKCYENIFVLPFPYNLHHLTKYKYNIKNLQQNNNKRNKGIGQDWTISKWTGLLLRSRGLKVGSWVNATQIYSVQCQIVSLCPIVIGVWGTAIMIEVFCYVWACIKEVLLERVRQTQLTFSRISIDRLEGPRALHNLLSKSIFLVSWSCIMLYLITFCDISSTYLYFS